MFIQLVPTIPSRGTCWSARTKESSPLNTYCLILDRDPAHAGEIAQFCSDHGIDALHAADLEEARSLLGNHDIVIAFVDLHGGVKDAQGSGLLLLQDGTLDAIDALIMSDHDNPQLADESIRLGASYFFCKPFDPLVIGPIFKDVFFEDGPPVVSDSPDDPCAMDQFGYLRGSSPSMRKLYRLLRKVAQTDASLMIVGESGTGKELVAQTVHTLSPRSAEPFIAVNCAAVPETLIESHLFGHERGSFSGAHSRHKGFFEQADGGTLFLDEITEMDLQMQTKLLRVLETQKFQRLGSEEAISVNVRFLSATNRSPEQAVNDGKLREDLYYRLAHFPVRVPPLRQRTGDIAGLAQYFLNSLNKTHDTSIAFTHDALAALSEKSWPGNVRELKHYVERAYIMSDALIDVADLPETISPVTQDYDGDNAGSNITVPTGLSLAETEQLLIMAALERNHGDKKVTADELGISLKTLYNRLREYDADTSDADTPSAT